MGVSYSESSAPSDQFGKDTDSMPERREGRRDTYQYLHANVDLSGNTTMFRNVGEVHDEG